MEPITMGILAGTQLLGGILNSRSQARQQRAAQQLQREGLNLQRQGLDVSRQGLDFAKGQYADRGQYRALLGNAVGQTRLANRPDYTERDNFRPLASSYSQDYDSAIQSLRNDSGRTGRVADAMREYDALDEVEFDKRVKTIGGNAARLGRLGAGETANEVTGLGREFALRRDQQRNQLLRDAIEGDLGDRYKMVDVTGRRAAEDLTLQQSNQAMRRQLGLDADARAGQQSAQAVQIANLLAGLGFGGTDTVLGAYGGLSNAYGGVGSAYSGAANQQFGQANQAGQAGSDAFGSLGQLLMMYGSAKGGLPAGVTPMATSRPGVPGLGNA